MPLIQLACKLLLVPVDIGLDTLGIGILIRRINGLGVAKSNKRAKVTILLPQSKGGVFISTASCLG